MKYLITLLFGACVVVPAIAGNDGPQGNQAQRVRLIAESRTSVGLFGPPDGAKAMALQISSDGSVQMSYYYQDKNPQVLQLAQLSVGVLNKLLADIEKSKAGTFVDPNPQSPGCEDAPSTTYSVTPSNGQNHEIFEVINCKDIPSSKLSDEDREVKVALDGLRALVPLAKQ